MPATNRKPVKSYYSPDPFDQHPAAAPVAMPPSQQQQLSSSLPASASASRAEQPGADGAELTKWRRVGLVSGTNVHLDTIVWPGGDIVVSGNTVTLSSTGRCGKLTRHFHKLSSDVSKCHKFSITKLLYIYIIIIYLYILCQNKWMNMFRKLAEEDMRNYYY